MSAEPVRIANDHLSATVSALGAEMQTLELADGTPLLWHGDPAWWGGRSPILFPIVGRAPLDRIALDGVEAPMAQHGFARRRTFRLEEAGPTFCRHVLTSDSDTLGVYPRAFRLSVSHSLMGTELTVRAEVTNDDDRPMPFGLGFHPAFLWPLPGQEDLPHVVRLDNGAEPMMARVEDGLLLPGRQPSPFTEGWLAITPDLFESDAAIFPEDAGEQLSYGVAGGRELHFRFHNLPNLALWQKPGAPFLCIEPWHGMAALKGAGPEIAERPFSVTLAPGHSRAFAFSVRVEG
ncbi:aldose 1-epimerase family protein [Pseudogemmobacter sonorensis]|uniref:aldose 1-epimerase family protein n=1 Tax=Pseudogemmobacter sonorensis TaxID=2989681 RepID=UPI0036BB739D